MRKIEILGADHGKCRAMEEAARRVATRQGVEREIGNVTDPMRSSTTPSAPGFACT
jgi:hypothetical protein